ncbi:2649_t:CDS:2, partial [Dentiscutata erythropus]
MLNDPILKKTIEIQTIEIELLQFVVILLKNLKQFQSLINEPLLIKLPVARNEEHK